MDTILVRQVQVLPGVCVEGEGGAHEEGVAVAPPSGEQVLLARVPPFELDTAVKVSQATSWTFQGLP